MVRGGAGGERAGGGGLDGMRSRSICFSGPSRKRRNTGAKTDQEGHDFLSVSICAFLNELGSSQ